MAAKQNKAILEISIFDSCPLGTAQKPCYLLPDCSLHSRTPDLTNETSQFALSAKMRANLNLRTGLSVPENPVRESDLFIQLRHVNFRFKHYHALNVTVILNLQISKQNGLHTQNKAIFEISIFDSCCLGTAQKPFYLLPEGSLHSGTPDLTNETTQFALSQKCEQISTCKLDFQFPKTQFASRTISSSFDM